MDQVHRRLRQRAWRINHLPKAHRKDAEMLKRAKARRDQRLAEEPPKKVDVIHAPITTSRAERLLFRLGLLTPLIAGVVAGLYAYFDPSPPPELKGFAVRAIILGCLPFSHNCGMTWREADRDVAGLKRFGRRPSQPTA